MVDQADLAEASYFDRLCIDEERARAYTDPAYWVPASEPPILIADMTDLHLAHTIAYLDRRHAQRDEEVGAKTPRHPKYNALRQEQKKRAISAQAETEYDR